MENENLTVEKNVAQENGTFQERLFFLDNITFFFNPSLHYVRTSP